MEQLAEDTHANGTTEFEETLETAKREHREVKEENDRLRARVQELEAENEQLQQRAEVAEANNKELSERNETARRFKTRFLQLAGELGFEHEGVPAKELQETILSEIQALQDDRDEAADAALRLQNRVEELEGLPDEVYDLEEALENRTRAHEDGPISIIQDGKVNFDKVWDVLKIVDEVAEEKNKLEEAIEDIQFTARIHTDQ